MLSKIQIDEEVLKGYVWISGLLHTVDNGHPMVQKQSSAETLFISLLCNLESEVKFGDVIAVFHESIDKMGIPRTISVK